MHFNQGGGGVEGCVEEPCEEQQCNLQHISEREPDDLDQDPSLHPSAGPLFLLKSKTVIESEIHTFLTFVSWPSRFIKNYRLTMKEPGN